MIEKWPLWAHMFDHSSLRSAVWGKLWTLRRWGLAGGRLLWGLALRVYGLAPLPVLSASCLWNNISHLPDAIILASITATVGFISLES